MSEPRPIQLKVNQKTYQAEAGPFTRLLDVLRSLELTGTKEGCGEGECGACSVLVDGELVNSCLIPVGQVLGSEITTVEGLSRDGQMTKLQQCFLEKGAAQCGICTPGMVMAAHHLLQKNPSPTAAEIRQGLAGNLCRCTGFTRIFDAVAAAAEGNKSASGGKKEHAR